MTLQYFAGVAADGLSDLLQFRSESDPEDGAASSLTAWCLSFGVLLCIVVAVWAAPKLWRRRKLAVSRRRKRAECARALEQQRVMLECGGVLTKKQVADITALSLEQLVRRLQTGALSAAHALEAYQRKALEVHGKTNCLVELITEAEQWAREADAQVGPRGALHGVPVSVKDLFGVEGYDSTVGVSHHIDQPMQDCVVVKVLKAHGAIPFAKTNVPQTMLSWENTNPIFGVTVNPRDITRGPGGSSGGEGALIAGGGSVLGVGSDLGGSIRLPAACCGVFGFKPTGGRTSLRGMRFAAEGQLCVPNSSGPLARDAHGLIECTKALLSPAMFNLDAYIPPVLFNEELFTEKKGERLRIGYYIDDGLFKPVPPNCRAVLEAVEALRRQGHEVVEWDFAQHCERFMPEWPRTVFADRGETLRREVQGDATDDAVAGVLYMLRLPGWLRRPIATVVRPWWPQLARNIAQMGGLDSVYAWWRQVELVKSLREEVVRDWQRLGLDAVIAPAMGCTPLPLGWTKYTMGALTYTSAFNMLNFPAGSMPVTTVQPQDLEAPYEIRDPWHRVAQSAMRGAEGLPVNVQVASLPWRDETCLAVMARLEEALRTERRFATRKRSDADATGDSDK